VPLLCATCKSAISLLKVHKIGSSPNSKLNINHHQFSVGMSNQLRMILTYCSFQNSKEQCRLPDDRGSNHFRNVGKLPPILHGATSHNCHLHTRRRENLKRDHMIGLTACLSTRWPSAVTNPVTPNTELLTARSYAVTKFTALSHRRFI
jgi:hypothetical protein